MTCHHGCSRPAVRHPRPQLVNSVAAGRITEQVDTVRIDILKNHQVLDQAIEHAVNVTLVPEIPGVGRCSWYQVDTLGRLVKPLLVLILLVIDLLRCPSAAVQ